MARPAHESDPPASSRCREPRPQGCGRDLQICRSSSRIGRPKMSTLVLQAGPQWKPESRLVASWTLARSIPWNAADIRSAALNWPWRLALHNRKRCFGTVQELEETRNPGLRPYGSCRPSGSERYGARWSPRQGSRAPSSHDLHGSTVTRLALEGLAAQRARVRGHSLQDVYATFLMLPTSSSARSTKLAEMAVRRLERDERREKKHLKAIK